MIDSKTQSISPRIEQGWKHLLADEFQLLYFAELKKFLVKEKQSGKVIYPPGNRIFAAFDYTPFDNVRVVIIGQDPYHGQGQANGLCFSVSDGVKPPPSLVNIFKELETDLKIPIPNHGNLEKWARQGVLLLNATLTVEANLPGSHQGKGWETFTGKIIQKLSKEKENLVFLLWGKFAQAKEVLIDTSKHYVLKAAHPSPFSVHSGFFGCRHFSETNRLLSMSGGRPIDWDITTPD